MRDAGSPLDDVVVEIDGTSGQQTDEAVPARERVADRLFETALGADRPTACFEEPVRVINDRAAALVTHAATLVSEETADLVVDGVEGSNVARHLGWQ